MWCYDCVRVRKVIVWEIGCIGICSGYWYGCYLFSGGDLEIVRVSDEISGRESVVG